MGVLDAPGGALGAEESAGVGHGLRFGDRPGWDGEAVVDFIKVVSVPSMKLLSSNLECRSDARRGGGEEALQFRSGSFLATCPGVAVKLRISPHRIDFWRCVIDPFDLMVGDGLLGGEANNPFLLMGIPNH